MTSTLKLGGIYFAMVFAAGFLLGVIRVLWAVPRFGPRASELVEAPIMIVVSALAARWLVRRNRNTTGWIYWLEVGLIGLGLMLLVEFTFVLWLRGLTLAEYLASRDPLSSAAYFTSLGVYAVLPLVLSRLRHGERAARGHRS